jgi:hypothetical protein
MKKRSMAVGYPVLHSELLYSDRRAAAERARVLRRLPLLTLSVVAHCCMRMGSRVRHSRAETFMEAATDREEGPGGRSPAFVNS